MKKPSSFRLCVNWADAIGCRAWILVCAAAITFSMGFHTHAQETPAADKSKPTPILSMHDAAETGDLARVKQLVGAGADVNALSNKEHEPPLIAALKGNQPAVAEFLLDHGADVKLNGEVGDTPLTHAANWGMTELIKRIISMGGDVRARDGRGRFPLHYAVERNQIEAARLVAAGPAVLNAADSVGNAPLDLAIAGAGQEMVLLLANAGARFNTNSELTMKRIDAFVQKRWFDALDCAIDQTVKAPRAQVAMLNRAYDTAFLLGDAEMLKHLVAKGASADRPTTIGDPQLVAAVVRSRAGIVPTLLDQGADVKQATPYSAWTPLHAAALEGDAATVKLLLSKGADPNALDGLGRTPLHLAAIAPNPLAVPPLLAAGAVAARADVLGNSALHYAAASGSLPIARALLKFHATQQPNQIGKTPYDIAEESGHLDVLAILQPSHPPISGYEELVPLLAANPSPETIAQTRERWVSLASHGTPLIHIAVLAQSLEAVQQLLSQDQSRLAARDLSGDLSIHLAAELPDTAILGELIAHGAAVNDHENISHWTPLHFAASAGNIPAIKLLLSKGANPKAVDALGQTPKAIAQFYNRPEVVAALP